MEDIIKWAVIVLILLSIPSCILYLSVKERSERVCYECLNRDTTIGILLEERGTFNNRLGGKEEEVKKLKGIILHLKDTISNLETWGGVYGIL